MLSNDTKALDKHIVSFSEQLRKRNTRSTLAVIFILIFKEECYNGKSKVHNELPRGVGNKDMGWNLQCGRQQAPETSCIKEIQCRSGEAGEPAQKRG